LGLVLLVCTEFFLRWLLLFLLSPVFRPKVLSVVHCVGGNMAYKLKNIIYYQPPSEWYSKLKVRLVEGENLYSAFISVLMLITWWLTVLDLLLFVRRSLSLLLYVTVRISPLQVLCEQNLFLQEICVKNFVLKVWILLPRNRNI
jgi:hypothetical protein